MASLMMISPIDNLHITIRIIATGDKIFDLVVPETQIHPSYAVLNYGKWIGVMSLFVSSARQVLAPSNSS